MIDTASRRITTLSIVLLILMIDGFWAIDVDVEALLNHLSVLEVD